jgi:hypothetical protein
MKTSMFAALGTAALLAGCAAGVPDAPPSRAEAQRVMAAIGFPALAPPPLIRIDPDFQWKWPNDNALSNPYIGAVLLPDDWRSRGGDAVLAGELMEYAVVKSGGGGMPHDSLECAGAIAAVDYATAHGELAVSDNMHEAASERFGCSFSIAERERLLPNHNGLASVKLAEANLPVVDSSAAVAMPLPVIQPVQLAAAPAPVTPKFRAIVTPLPVARDAESLEAVPSPVKAAQIPVEPKLTAPSTVAAAAVPPIVRPAASPAASQFKDHGAKAAPGKPSAGSVGKAAVILPPALPPVQSVGALGAVIPSAKIGGMPKPFHSVAIINWYAMDDWTRFTIALR